MLVPPIPVDEEERLQTLHDLNILDTPAEECFECITRITKSLFNVPIVAITLIDENRQWFKSNQGLNSCETNRETSFCAHAILQDDIFKVLDPLKDPRFADNPFVTGPPYIRFYAGYPVKAKNGKKLGTLCIIDNKPRQFSEDELSRLKDMAELVEAEIHKHVISFSQKKLISELNEAKRASLIDPLTQLWNREGLMRILIYQLAYSDEHNRYFGVAIADIDHFKKINDQYGHNVGDEVLRNVSRQLLQNCRQEDAVGRWGGEEFLIVIDTQEEKTLLEILERFRKGIEEVSIEVNEVKVSVTVTIGAARFDPQSKMSLLNLIELADKALYQGKESGRNRVIVA